MSAERDAPTKRRGPGSTGVPAPAVLSIDALAADAGFRAVLDVWTTSGAAGRAADLPDITGLALQSAEGLNLAGLAAARLGFREAALDLFAAAVEKDPSRAEHHVNRAVLLEAGGQRAEALAACRVALTHATLDVDGHLALTNLLARLGEIGEAEDILRRLLAVAPTRPDLHFTLGTLLMNAERNEPAETSLRDALALDPGFAEALNNLGLLRCRQGQFGEAEALYHQAITRRPDIAAISSNLGDLLRVVGRLEEGESVCREALRLDPNFASAQLNLGNILREQGRFHEAEHHYRRALELRPGYPEALNNLGGLMFDLGRPQEGVPLLVSACGTRPDYAEAHVNLAMLLLLAGRYAEGWREYEWRWRQAKNRTDVGRFTQPLWDGEDLGERVLLIHAEQGLGDTLQFCRYVPLLAQGHRVVFEAQRELVPLLAGLPGVSQVVALGDPLPPFDLHAPLLSLPRIFGTLVQTIPGSQPYLRADPIHVARWRARLAEMDGLKIGIAWAGSPGMPADRRRSMPAERLADLSGLPGCRFISLQKGPAANRAALPEFELVDWTDELTDFSETAALVDALDLVLSVDTAVAHLAGALGRPVWLLNRYDRCWRWGLQGEASPWYPTLRQFRQPQPGDWESVVRQVRAALASQIGDAAVNAGAAAAV